MCTFGLSLWAIVELATAQVIIDDSLHYVVPVATDAAMIGQLLLVHIRYHQDGSKQLELDDSTRAMLAEVQPGGVVLYGANISSAQQVRKLIADIRAVLRIPPFIAIDEEGGRVSRIRGLEGTAMIPSARNLALRGEDAIEKAYSTIGNELIALNINMDLAPVADLGFYPARPYLGDRAFSSKPEIVSRAVAIAVNALQTRGVIAVVKHFPGHGRTQDNSHETGAVIKATRAELEADLQPFRAAFAVGAGGLMTAHVAYPVLDATGLVASISEPILQGLARQELGFNGLIVTDAIEMRGLTPQISEKDAALAAFMAGADLLMGPTNPLEIRNHLNQALSPPHAKVETRATRARILDSYRRIMMTKYKYKIAPPQY
ncbi:MAG: beta-N-acetylhexosaminidase [Candidatus Nitrotoga sp. SPKER]|nr:MAG: beta-N-acetylhexosaminidase [Candidatus Nitrotoga sp. SPKER]